jgi:hypothetical protein
MCAGLFAGGKHGALLPWLLQQNDLASFPLFSLTAQYKEEYWQEYQNVNRIFGEAVVNALQPDDVVWIHNYHLMLLPKLIRQRFREMPIGFFLQYQYSPRRGGIVVRWLEWLETELAVRLLQSKEVL